MVSHFKDTITVHLISKKGVVLGSSSKCFLALESKDGILEYDALAVIYTLRSVINSLYTDYKLKPGLIESKE